MLNSGCELKVERKEGGRGKGEIRGGSEIST